MNRLSQQCASRYSAVSAVFVQVTLAGGPPIQPEWNHSFLFTQHRDKATLFTPAAALVIEYFNDKGL